MFEYKIQESWENFRQDMGLGRILLFLAFANTFLFFLSGTVFHAFQMRALYPVLFSLSFFALRPLVIKADPKIKFALNVIPVALCIILNYYLVGVFDYSVDGLTRQDQIFHQFDLWVYGQPISQLIYHYLGRAGLLSKLIYDIMMLSYISYFLLPLIGGILYFRNLSGHYEKLGRYFFSVILYFQINFLLYLIVPVTGPQYYLTEYFTKPLPFTPFGQFLWQSVQEGQTTFIDCFPSGHTGIAFLVTIWLFRINHPARYILATTTTFIVMATLAMRYHYTLDLLCAFPLAYFCHRVAWVFIPVKVTPE